MIGDGAVIVQEQAWLAVYAPGPSDNEPDDPVSITAPLHGPTGTADPTSGGTLSVEEKPDMHRGTAVLGAQPSPN